MSSSTPPETPPQAPAPRKAVRRPLAWVNIGLLFIIVVACNYIGCREYARRDLTEDQRYTISERTKNVLSSPRIQNRETPVKIIFAFQRSTQNYSRMYSLLEEYRRAGRGKIEIECFDPLRQPNRAREITQIYGTEFYMNLVIVDARTDTTVSLKTFEEERSESNHVQTVPGTSFVKYETLPDGQTKRAVALMMDDVVCTAVTKAVEGETRTMYVVEGKGGVSPDDVGLVESLAKICAPLNIDFAWLDIANAPAVPQDAEGLIVLSPKSDFNEHEIGVLNSYWEGSRRAAIFMVLDPVERLPRLFRFLREQGIRPQSDRVLLRDRTRAYYDISAVIPKGLLCTRDFWNSTTQLEGQSMSLKLEYGDENMANVRRLATYPLLMTTSDYYGETNPNLKPSFDVREDHPGPLCLGAAVTKGDPNRPNELSTLAVFSNADMLAPNNTKTAQMDYLRTILAWMSDRPEYAGKSNNRDLTMKIDLNRHSRSALELLTLVAMPGLALLIALIFWNTRRH